MKHKIAFTIIAFLLAPALGLAQGESRSRSGGGSNFDLRKKAENKASKRWTLQEWLETKDRNMMMDLWLGMYSPSPYEFYFGGTYQNQDATKTTNFDTPAALKTESSGASYTANVGAYAYLIGLQGEYENNTEAGFNDLTGSLNIRVLGNAVQGTHLILGYGMRTRNSNGIGDPLRQQFGQADLDLYVMKAFGIHGLYRGFVPNYEAVVGDMTGSQSEAGIFLDFGALRVYGNWFSETQSFEKTTGITKNERTGIQSGLKIFF